MMIPDTSLVAPYVLVVIGVFVVLWLYFKGKISDDKLKALQKKYNRELHIRKSSEVRLGKIGENLAPFTKGWPWDANNFRFLGNPIDGIQFNDDGIIFVEIKTGKARLSKSQKDFKTLVDEGKVSFATFKITDEGIKLTRE